MIIPGEHATHISIVAGGWSVRDVDLARLPGIVIGINESALLIERTDIIVTMDRLWTEHRWNEGPPSKPNYSLKKLSKPAWIRRSAMQNLPGKWPWLNVFDCDHTTGRFSESRYKLNGPNSGHCALNLAFQMRPLFVFLFGFDMQRGPNGQPYWYPAYDWNPEGSTSRRRYQEWTSHLKEAANQFKLADIKVFNCSKRSLIDVFEKIDPQEVLKEAA